MGWDDLARRWHHPLTSMQKSSLAGREARREQGPEPEGGCTGGTLESLCLCAERLIT
jgi:hypothetical protein